MGGDAGQCKFKSELLGGNLNNLKHESQSIFDQIILKSFNEHLEVTLGNNQFLYEKYPYYLKMIQGYPYEEPTTQPTKSSGHSSPKKVQDEITKLGF